MPFRLPETTWFYIENNQQGRLFVDADSLEVKVDVNYREGEQYLWRFHWEDDACLLENKLFGLCGVVTERKIN